MTDGDLCRSDGSTLQLVMTGHNTAIVRRNTLSGEGAVQIGHSEGDTSDRIDIRDNLVIGYPLYRDPIRRSAFDGGKSKAAISYSGNMAWKVAACPGDTQCTQDPKLTNMALGAFDAKPLTGSPAHGKAGAVTCGKAAAP
jgi:hypothetical protein